MERLLYEDLKRWTRSSNRLPLILRGARQVGKTYLLKQFGGREFKRYHHFDFEKNGKRLSPLFDGDLSPSRLLRDLSLLAGEQIDSRESLVVFDEIQNCPRALTALKYFAEDLPEQAVCAAGSLLGVMLSGESFPVGKVSFLDLYPLSFHEFLLNSADEMLCTAFEGIFLDESPSRAVHDRLWDLLKQYYVVGGMPQVVAAFVGAGAQSMDAFSAARAMQRGLLDTYMRDFNKHAGNVNAVHIASVFENIPRQLSADVDGSVGRYRFRDVVPGKCRFADLSGPIDWLVKSGLVYKGHVCTRPELPLMAFTKPNIFKLFVFDVGLLGCLLELDPGIVVLQDYGQTKGYFAESFVACELVSGGQDTLYSWSGRNSEVEFLTVNDGEIVPVEVKSGTRTKAQSLRTYMEKYRPRVAIKVTANPFRLDRLPIRCIPLYCAGQLPKHVDTICAE